MEPNPRAVPHPPALKHAGSGPAATLCLPDALTAREGGRAARVDHVSGSSSFEDLREVKAAQARLAADLLADGVPAPEIQGLISDINNGIHRRVVALSLAAMAEASRGHPPVRFSVIVMGSGGRGESCLLPDQDHGFVLADYPDEDHPQIDAFFIELADCMTGHLDRLGFPPCRGGVMALNPVWRKTIGQWRLQIARWIQRRSDMALQLCDVLFDFRSVYGEEALAERLRTGILARIGAHPGFLRDLYGVQAEHRAGLGWFGRLLTERDDPENRGKLDLKYAGTLPLAEAVRLLALKEGIAATGTLARIEALTDSGTLSHKTHDALCAAFDHITGLHLRQQIADLEAGRPASSFIDPAGLDRRETEVLKNGLRAINRFRARVRADLTGAF